MNDCFDYIAACATGLSDLIDYGIEEARWWLAELVESALEWEDTEYGCQIGRDVP